MDIIEITTDSRCVNHTTIDSQLDPDNPDVFGKHEFLNSKPWTAWPTIVVLSVASFVGTSGNVLTLLAIAMNKSVRNIESMFIVNLAISDLYVTTVADPMSIIAKLEGEQFFDEIPNLCKIVAKLCTISCVTSLLTIATMSLNRYIYVCHNKYYKMIFSKGNSVIICMSVYCVGLLLVLLNLAGVGDHRFDRKSLECIWDRMATYPYTVIYSVTLVWIPCGVIGICYLRLYVFVNMHKKKVFNHTRRNTQSNNVVPKPHAPKLKLAKTFILIYAVFVICWAPYALLIVIDYKDHFKHEIHVYLTVWAHLHPSINWLIYYRTQRKLADAYHQILACTMILYVKKSNHFNPQSISDIKQAEQKSEDQYNSVSKNNLQKSVDTKNTTGNATDIKITEVLVENQNTLNNPKNMTGNPTDVKTVEVSVENPNYLNNNNNNVKINNKIYDKARTFHSEGEVVGSVIPLQPWVNRNR